MFSSMLQGLLAASGQSNAMQRAVQMNNYVNKYNDVWAPVEKTTVQNSQINNTQVQSFDKVLQNSATVRFGDLLTKPVTKVNASIYTNQAQEANRLTPRQKIQDIVSRMSKKHGVDEKLVNALIKQESGFNPNAKSKVGAMGLMQLMPSTAKSLGVTDGYDPTQNIMGGAKLISGLLKEFNGDLDLAMAAYSNGSGAVHRAGNKVPDIRQAREFVSYIKSVMGTDNGK